MEFVFELLLQFFWEILLQLIIQVLAELGLHSLGNTFQRRKHPIWSMIGFTLWGAIAGGLSLLVLPHSAIAKPAFRTLNVFVTPLVVGAVMALIGQTRLRRGQVLVRMDRFGYAFTFAFWMAFVRFLWAT